MVFIYSLATSPYQILKLYYFKCYNFNELLECLMVDYLMKLNNVHLCNLGLVSDMVMLNMCQSIDIMNRIIYMFNDYNVSLHQTTFYALDDIETDT